MLQFLCTLLGTETQADDAVPSPVQRRRRPRLRRLYVAERPYRVGYRRLEFEVTTTDSRNRPQDNWTCGIPNSCPGTQAQLLWSGGTSRGEWCRGEDAYLCSCSHTAFCASDQSIFLTEACARAGYIVIAMTHQDALFNRRERGLDSPEFADAASWNDSKYRDRRRPQPNQEQEKPTLYCLRPALLSLRLILCIAVQAVVNSPPDGYTLLFLGASAIVNTSMNGSPHHFSRPQPAPALSMSCRPRCGETWVGGASSQPTATMDQALTTIILSTSCAFASCDLPSSSGRPP